MRPEVPEIIERWFNKVVSQSLDLAENSEAKRLILRKIEHTERVVDWGRKIMEKENQNWNFSQGLAVCKLHDIGRFPQALLGTFVDEKSLNHAKKGQEIFESAKIDLSSFNGVYQEIAEAIGEHNNPDYTGNNRYCKLTRDADQMTIIDELEWQLSNFKSSHIESGLINGELVEKYKRNEVINSREAKTIGEWLLCLTSWKKRFNFPATLQLFTEYKFEKKIAEKHQEMFPKDSNYKKLLLT